MRTITQLRTTVTGIALALAVGLTAASAQVLEVGRERWIPETKPDFEETFAYGKTVVASPPIVGYTHTLLTVTNLGPNTVSIELELIETGRRTPRFEWSDDLGPYRSYTFSTASDPTTGFILLSGWFEPGEVAVTMETYHVDWDDRSASEKTSVTAE